MNYTANIERLERDLESLRRELSSVRENLSHIYDTIEEEKYEACKFKEQEKELLESIKEIKEELNKEEKKVRCPKCGQEFKLEEIKDLLQEDEWGQYWKCPNKLCTFKGYHEKGNFFFEFEELMKRRKDKEKEFYEKNFIKLDIFI